MPGISPRASGGVTSIPSSRFTNKEVKLPSVSRPSGSGQGLNALSASITGNAWSGTTALPQKKITGQVDIARSSSGWGNFADSTNGKLAYIPFARDAVGFAYKGGTGAWAHLTLDQVKAALSAEIGAPR